MRGAPCKHYICEAHASTIYGGENADWRSAAQARLATVLAAADGWPGRRCGRIAERRLSPAGTYVSGLLAATPLPAASNSTHASVCMYWLSGLCGVSPVACCDRPRRAPPLSVVAYVGPVRRPPEGDPRTPL